MKPVDLIAYLFEGKPHLLTETLQGWMIASPRFTAFAETYRDKIRKKIRIAREQESAFDLGAELEVAYCLLNYRYFSVVYEPYASTKRRGPDFAVTYRVNLVFNIEVARIREGQSGINGLSNGNDINLPHKEERILRILLDKLGQIQPGMANLLVLYTRTEVVRSIDLARLMKGIKSKVDAKDPAFYSASRYTSPAAFYKDFLQLSGILLWAAEAQLWVNKQARHGIGGKVLRLVSSLPTGTPPV